MNVKYQIQIKTHNWSGNSPVITEEISLNDLTKFSNLAAMINHNSGGKTWNWFNGIPLEWDGHNYVTDVWRLCNHMKECFDYNVEDTNLVKEFYLRFTPNGCDGIEWIKFFKIEELTDW